MSKRKCPYCGTWSNVLTFELLAVLPNVANGYQVRCDGCGARGPIDSNKRTAESLFYNMQLVKK